MNIPKKMYHIWIGPLPPPDKWMKTWIENHPDWKYEVFDNQKLKETNFYNQELIDEYIKVGRYSGAADLIRYELLYKEGGFIPPADAICLNNTEELWIEPIDYCYTVYESETLRPGFVSPIYAANEKNKFLEILINTLKLTKLTDVLDKDVYKVTGNEFLCRMIENHNPKIKIFPSHYFIPKHFKAKTERYNGPDKIYADQMWGTTRRRYSEGI